jgi:hypothetical protein
MSKFDCKVCGKDAEGQGVWGPDGGRICHSCQLSTIRQINKLLGILGDGTMYGLEITWEDAAGLLARLEHDPLRQAFYLTEKDRYEAVPA